MESVHISPVADPGEGKGRPAASPLFLDQKIYFFWDRAPHPLSEGLDPSLFFCEHEESWC